MRKKVFKTKAFDRWSRKLVSDLALCKAAQEIERGIFEADLGQGLCKKRIAVPGQGKSGSTRALVAKRHPRAIIFLAGREKSTTGTDFPDAVVEAAKIIAVNLQKQDIGKLQQLAADGVLKEICHDP
jgi:hypothetical protein